MLLDVLLVYVCAGDTAEEIPLASPKFQLLVVLPDELLVKVLVLETHLGGLSVKLASGLKYTSVVLLMESLQPLTDVATNVAVKF